MNYRTFLVVLMICSTGFVASSRSWAASARSVPAAQPSTRTASLPSDKTSSAASAGRTFRSLGALSSPAENEDIDPDDIFIAPPSRGAAGSSSQGSLTGSSAATAPAAMVNRPLAEHPNAPQWIEQLAQSLRGSEVDVALLGSHKYMVADCLGIKVSAGTFKLRLAEPRVYFQGTSLVFECGIDHVSFSAIKLRMKPNPNVLELCKFSKKFEVGGSADDVTLKLRLDPLVDLQHCRVYSAIQPETTVRIGNLNLKPLQNDLDRAAKNAVEDALTAFLNFNFYDQVNRVLDDMIEADCPGGDVRAGIESTFGGGQRDHTNGGGGGAASDSGSASVAALEQRLHQLETRVTQLEQQAAGFTTSAPSAGSPSDGGTTASDSTPDARGTSGSRGMVSDSGNPPGWDIQDNTKTRPATGVSTRTARPGAAAFTIAPNPELRGRLGRLVVTFPAGTKDLKARTGTFKAGDPKEIRADFGDVATELTPGAYDLEISGRKVPGVVVQSRSDTRVSVGVLRVNGSTTTRFGVFVPGEKKELQALFGSNDLGLPAGSFEIEVNGQRELVTITAGTITEY